MSQTSPCLCGADVPMPEDRRRFRCHDCGRVHAPRDVGWLEPRKAPAEPRDWQRRGLDDPVEVFRVEWPYDAEDLERIRWGLVPQSMEDKWFVYAEGDVATFVRSWTGEFCFRAVLCPEGIREVAVSQRFDGTPEESLRILRWVTDTFLVGLEVEGP